MVNPRFVSIAAKGGLAVHLREQGIDPQFFYDLDVEGVADTAIARQLNKRYPHRSHPIHRETVGNWREIRKHEVEHETSTDTTDKPAALPGEAAQSLPDTEAG